MHCLYFLHLDTSIKIDYCTLIKEDHNAEKAFSVTMFGFEIKIMDKYCVCCKQPAMSRLQAHPGVKSK